MVKLQRVETMNKSKHKPCPVCHHEGMSVFFEIVDLPIHCTLLWPSREAALNSPKGAIRLGFCRNCGMIYNMAFDPSLMQYTQQYENSLHFSPHFQGYARELATQLVKKYHLQGKTIIEIGCGSGEFLSMLCEGGENRGVGFDPSFAGKREDSVLSEHLTFIKGYYSEAYAEYKTDFICCRHVLEHVVSPADFLSQIRQAIRDRPDCMVFFEVPTVLYTLRDLSIWDIIYEHCSYFCASSLTRAFTESGFNVLEASEAFSGQALCIEATPTDGIPASHSGQWDSSAEIQDLVYGFAESYQEKLNAWRNHFRKFTLNGKKAVLWGAGARGSSFLNMLNATAQIEHVVDISPRKHGKYMGGTGQQIVAPKDLEQLKPDVIILTNPVYENEIKDFAKSLGLHSEFLVA